MPGLPSYEDTQRGVDLCPLYENVVLESPHPLPNHRPPSTDLWHHQPAYPLNAHVNHSPSVRLQVSLPPEWPSDCATLTNYRYDTLDGLTANQSEPSLLLDSQGRPLQPGGANGSVPLLQQQRVGQYVEAQNAVLAGDLYQSTLGTSPTRDIHPGSDGGNTTYEEFMMGMSDDDSRYRRRERTCAKGFFVVCLIISAIAIIVFLVIAVLKSVHII